MIKQYEHAYINGQWSKVQGQDKIDVINPATEEVLAQVSLAKPLACPVPHRCYTFLMSFYR